MNTSLVIVAVLVVLAAQAVTVYVVRRLVKRWCSDVFAHAYKAGERAGVEASDPFRESYRLGYDVGLERGHSEGYDAAVNDAVDAPDRFADRLQEIRGTQGRRWIDDGSGPGHVEGEH